MIGRDGIELGERWKARRRRRRHELIDVEAADRRDPFAVRQRRCLRGERFERGRNRMRVLEPSIVAGAKSEQHDVIVVVDDTGDHGAALQIDSLRAGRRARAAADGRETVADDLNGAHDRVARIHRVDAAVYEQQVRAERAAFVALSERRSGRREQAADQERSVVRCRACGLHARVIDVVIERPRAVVFIGSDCTRRTTRVGGAARGTKEPLRRTRQAPERLAATVRNCA